MSLAVHSNFMLIDRLTLASASFAVTCCIRTFVRDAEILLNMLFTGTEHYQTCMFHLNKHYNKINASKTNQNQIKPSHFLCYCFLSQWKYLTTFSIYI